MAVKNPCQVSRRRAGFGRGKDTDKKAAHDHDKQDDYFNQAAKGSDLGLKILLFHPGRHLGINRNPDIDGEDKQRRKKDSRQNPRHK
jgi:hypothetical protein